MLSGMLQLWPLQLALSIGAHAGLHADIEIGALPQPSRPVLQALICDQQFLLQNCFAEWSAYRVALAGEFTRNVQLCSGWRKRSTPPPPNYESVHAPLCVLAIELERRPDWHNAAGWLNAIAASSDARRADYLCEVNEFGDPPFHGKLGRWVGLASNTEWAVKALPGMIASAVHEPPPRYLIEDALFEVIRHNADEMPLELRTACYEYIRRCWTLGPSNGDGEHIWEVLLRLDLNRARHDIAEYWGKTSRWRDRDDYYVVKLLLTHAGPSPETAENARRWLANSRNDAYASAVAMEMLPLLLVRSAPETECERAAAGIVDRLRDKSASNTLQDADASAVSGLFGAIIDAGYLPARDVIAPLIREPRLEAWQRIRALGWLLETGHSAASQELERWFHEESQINRDDLLYRAKQWSPAAQRQVEEAAKR